MLINQGLSHSTKQQVQHTTSGESNACWQSSSGKPSKSMNKRTIWFNTANPALATIRRITSMSHQKVTIGS